MAPQRGDGWEAVARVEDKLTDFIDEARELLREQQKMLAEQQKFMSELATRQAVMEERVRRAESDLAVTAAEANKAHRRIDQIAVSRSEEVGMRKGVVAGITFVATLGGSGVAVAVVKLLGG